LHFVSKCQSKFIVKDMTNFHVCKKTSKLTGYDSNVPLATAKLRLCQFLVRDVIYTSRAYATMSVSVCLSVCDVCALCMVTVCNGSWTCLHAWIDGCRSLLLTDNASPGSSDGMMPGFLVEEGEYGKIGNCRSLILLTESLDWKHVTVLTMLTF